MSGEPTRPPKWVEQNVDISYRFFLVMKNGLSMREPLVIFSLCGTVRAMIWKQLDFSYHRPIHARGLSASLAASVLKLSE